jgi:hypothetical protein
MFQIFTKKMSTKLDALETKMLLKEFSYLISDIEFKSEFVIKHSRAFDIAIRQFLKERPFIKEICIDKFGNELQEENKKTRPPTEVDDKLDSSKEIAIFTGKIIEIDDFNLEFDEVKMKKLYRDVVQKTHPDKTKSDALSFLYKKATTANKAKDTIGLYSICDELGIELKISQKEVDAIKNKIKKIKHQQKTFEESHLWAWCENEYDENKRKEIIQHFLLNNAPVVKDLFKK